MLIEKVMLNDGNMMPRVGLGTYEVRGGQGLNQILAAIQSGYRLLDTSTNYDSEGIVGEAIRRSGVRRSDFFVTTKLPGKYHHYKDTLDAIQESLCRMGLAYFDLYLIHWPLPQRNLYDEAWRAMITAQQLGLVRSIGVSNFEPQHLDHLIQETGVAPAVNQIEVHPYWIYQRMIDENQKRNIVTEAWSPLGRHNEAKSEATLVDLARKYHKTPSQIILRWHLDKGVVPLPRSQNLAHQRDNLTVFDFKLTHQDMALIDTLTQKNGRIDNQDPNTYEEFE